MAFELPTLPNFNTTIPQQIAAMPSPLEQYGKMLQLRALSGQIGQQQQMQPLQVQQAQQSVQAATLENQQRQQELDSQKAMIKAWSDPDFLKAFTGTDAAQQSGVGFDPNALTSSLINKGVLPKDAMAMTSQFVDRSAKIADTLKAQAQTGEANAATRDKGMKILADKIAGILDLPSAKAGDALAVLKQDLVKNPQAYARVPKDDLALVYGADLEHLPAMATLIGLDAKIADFHKSKAEAASAEYKQQQEQIAAAGGLTDEAKQKIAEETDPQVLQARAQQAAMTAQIVEPLRLQIQQTFVNQKDARDKIETTVLKPFQDKMSEIGELQSAINQAAQGNIAAARAALYKTIGVAQPAGTHRVAPTEVTGFSGMGSIPERIRGSIANALSGDPWTPQMVQDIKSFGQMQAQVALGNLSRGIDNTNKLYGTNVGTALKEQPVAQPVAQPAGAGKTLSMSALQQAAKDHGVSVDEATRQAKAAGYEIK